MLTHPFNYGVWISIALAGFTHAHMAGFHPAMYCVNVIFHPSYRNFPAYALFPCVLLQGSDPNRYDNEAVNPLTNMTFDEYWLHGKVTFNLLKHTLFSPRLGSAYHTPPLPVSFWNCTFIPFLHRLNEIPEYDFYIGFFWPLFS